MVKRVVLRAEALDYVRSQLEQGRVLAREILADPPRNWVDTFVPEDISPETLVDFDGGCLGDTVDTFIPAWTLAEQYLRAPSPDQRYLISEHTFASKTDPFLIQQVNPFFTYEDDVYFFLAAEDVSTDHVHGTIAAGGHYPWIAVLTSLPPESPRLRSRSEQPRTVLKTLAHRADHILVGAYDE
jgi:hypothetical protein